MISACCHLYWGPSIYRYVNTCHRLTRDSILAQMQQISIFYAYINYKSNYYYRNGQFKKVIFLIIYQSLISLGWNIFCFPLTFLKLTQARGIFFPNLQHISVEIKTTFYTPHFISPTCLKVWRQQFSITNISPTRNPSHLATKQYYLRVRNHIMRK